MTPAPSSGEPGRASASPESSRPLFSARATTLCRLVLGGAVLAVIGSGFVASAYFHSASWEGIGFAPAQPVPFSHQVHAGKLRLDCRDCHSTVETSAFAGMPSTEVCLACHSQVMTDAPALTPVMDSEARRVPLPWSRVTHLPDHVFFDHSIHVGKGVSCVTCHGDVGTMAVIAKSEPLTMRWCLDCHRDPGPRLVPPSAIFASTAPHAPAPAQPMELLRYYHVRTGNLLNCSTCHH